MCVCVERSGEGGREGDLLQELAHVITEADKSRDLQSANSRPRRADGGSSRPSPKV